MWNIQDEVWNLFTAAGLPGGQYQSGSSVYNPAERMLKGAAAVTRPFLEQAISNNKTMVPGGSGMSPVAFLSYSGPTPADIAESKVSSAGWSPHALVPFEAFASALITRAESLQVSASPSAITAGEGYLTGLHSFSIVVPAIPTSSLADTILSRFRSQLVDSIDTEQRTLFATLLAEVVTSVFGDLSASIALTGSNTTGSPPPPGTPLQYIIGTV